VINALNAFMPEKPGRDGSTDRTITFVNYSFAGSADGFAVEGRKLIGGGEVYLHDLCHVLQDAGWQTRVIQGGGKDESFDFDGIPVTQIKSRGRYWFNFEWKRGLKGGGKDGIVHLHDANHAFPFDSGHSATFHGVSWDVPYAGGGIGAYLDWRARYRFFKTLINHAIINCTRIVSVDTFLLRYVQSEFPNERDKIKVIPNYVDLDAFAPRQRKRSDDKFVVFFPRNLTRNRGVYLMLDVLRRIPDDDLELWVAGTSYGAEAVRKAAGDDSRIKFLGHKDHYKDMPQLYAESDLVVVPSLGVEGTSLSCLEAMASGKPVLASNIGGLIDIITDGKNGFLETPKSEAFLQRLIEIKDDDKLRSSVAKNARPRAQDFSKERWAASWRKFAQEQL